MKKIIYTITIITVLIGIVGFTMNYMFGSNTVVYLQQQTINGVTVMKYDFFSYADNLQNSFTQASDLTLALPQKQFHNVISLGDLWDNFAAAINYILLALNVLIYPLRIAFYAIRIVLAIIGLPVSYNYLDYANNNLAWLIHICNTMVTMQIPYIQ